MKNLKSLFLFCALLSATAEAAEYSRLNSRLIIWTQFPLKCENEIDFPSLKRELLERFGVENRGHGMRLYFPGEGIWFSVHMSNATQRELRREPGDAYLSGIDLVVESVSSGKIVARHHLGDHGELNGRFGTDIGDVLYPRDGFIVAEDYWLDDIVPDYKDGELYRLGYEIVDREKFAGIRLDADTVYVLRRHPVSNREKAISLIRKISNSRDRKLDRKGQVALSVQYVQQGRFNDPKYLEEKDKTARQALKIDNNLCCAWWSLVGTKHRQKDLEGYRQALKDGAFHCRFFSGTFQQWLEDLEKALKSGRDWGLKD